MGAWGHGIKQNDNYSMARTDIWEPVIKRIATMSRKIVSSNDLDDARAWVSIFIDVLKSDSAVINERQVASLRKSIVRIQAEVPRLSHDYLVNPAGVETSQLAELDALIAYLDSLQFNSSSIFASIGRMMADGVLPEQQ